VPCAENVADKKKKLIDALNVKQNCVWMGISRAVTQIFSLTLVVFIMHIQNIQLIKQAVKVIISSALCKNSYKIIC
jgi:hypothetical protein